MRAGVLKSISVRLTQGKLSFGNVPVGALREFGGALTKVRLPEDAKVGGRNGKVGGGKTGRSGGVRREVS